MYIRVKTTPNSPRKSVQIVASVRDGLKIRQKIVRYVGIAMDDKELEKLKDLAEYIKCNIENEQQPSLFPVEELAQMAIDCRKRNEEVEESVKLKDVVAVQEVITGVHDIYGEIYSQIGFDKAIAQPASHESALNRLYHIVMGRIASPSSKRDTVKNLADNFGINFSLDSVYRMMDLIDEQTVQRINTIARSSAESLFKEKVKVLFYDCTTLYFESFKPDELKENGYSKDLKFNQPQVLLALMVTTDGLPLGYEVFPGSTFEGHTLRIMIEKLKEDYEIESITFVADSAMLSSENLNYQRLKR
jgi:transposase